MTIDWTKPVALEDGTPLKVLTTERPGKYPQVVCMAEDGRLYPFYADGTSDIFTAINVKIKREGWIAITSDESIENGRIARVTHAFATEEQARSNFRAFWVYSPAAVIHVSWEE